MITPKELKKKFIKRFSNIGKSQFNDFDYLTDEFYMNIYKLGYEDGKKESFPSEFLKKEYQYYVNCPFCYEKTIFHKNSPLANGELFQLAKTCAGCGKDFLIKKGYK